MDPFSPGTTVCAHLHDKGATVTGEVVATPTKKRTACRLKLPDDEVVSVDVDSVWCETDDEMCADCNESTLSTDPLPPSWLCDGCGITVRTEHGYKRGTLRKDNDTIWKLQVCPEDVGGDMDECVLEGMHSTWRQRVTERELTPGWPADPNAAEMSLWLQLSAATPGEVSEASVDGTRTERMHHARHASAAGLKAKLPPSNLREALKVSNPDHPIWLASHKEACESLKELDTFTEINDAQLKQHVAAGCEVVPTMTVFTIKPNEKGEPCRAKARTVALGNLEQRTWTKESKCAPALGQIGARSLASEAVSRGRRLKQGDCKNAFCQPELPEDETVIVTPPKGCPCSKPGTCWKLNKTLHGLCRSPRHWCDKTTGVLSKLGFKPADHDPCLWRTCPDDGKSPVWVGLHVDDFECFSETDEQELWFENEMKKSFTVDFMGPVSCFLGCRCDWIDQEDGSLSLHISQEGHVDAMLDKFGMTDCKRVAAPFRSGLPIDRIPDDEGISHARREMIAKELRSVLGCTAWLCTSARPDIGVSNSLLASHQSKASQGHLDGARHLLRHLASTKDCGTAFHQNLQHCDHQWPLVEPGVKTHTCTDSNWGPQDASKPLPPGQETRTVTREECLSIGGCLIVRQGGLVAWCLQREKRISGSSCEAEIKGMDEGTKGTQCVRCLEDELDIGAPDIPAPFCNDCLLQSGRKLHFQPVPTAELTTMAPSFKLAPSGSIALCAMAEKHNPLLETIHWSSQSQSPSTVSAKTGLFPSFRRLKAERGRKKGSFGVPTSRSVVL